MKSVRDTPELARILALPRREPTPSAELVQEMSELLRLPGSTKTLFPLQALALHDIAVNGGGFPGLDVGEGKTLISLLTPRVLDAQRPLILLPAHLIGKTALERDEYAKDWWIPSNICFQSFQMLGLVQAEAWLEQYEPDLIVADETQKLKDQDTAVTRRVARYMARHPKTKFVAMTGSITRRSIVDFGHYLRWCLKENAPIPETDHELEEWANALDEKIADEFSRLDPGPMLKLCTPEEAASNPPIVAARLGFQRRLRETSGVIMSAASGSGPAGVPLKIRPLRYEMSDVTIQHFRKLREQWQTPDGWQLMEGNEVWRHAREMALGFHQVWDPRPPEPWRQARRAWSSFVREVLSRSRSLDSPKQVRLACEAGKLPRHLLDAWLEEESKPREDGKPFEVHEKPLWHDDSALRVAADWAQRPGIIWVSHIPFGQRLAQMAGLKYYGAKGLAEDGEFIDNADPRRAVIASVKANREGRNLQRKWSRNLITTPEEGGDLWQQILGRTHRTGQTAPEVTVDVFVGCVEHLNAWRSALAGARYIRDITGVDQRLLVADRSAWPSDNEIASWSGPRWGC